ncbi:uncharacterized protein SPAPADRAFT_142181 [Spathaspora passalidarum NRRL Y-27907]|uniref:MHD domain-containing protein n=1 Tax=Spathaspora passalidarum (strain NRRL Y-27907 / 11-Y1) TaxID=619300 RepID=G3ASA4_SPAPN|nr:uncharacterized protein SPAPADRAFT_142181 [Spathaspora passalidarum NRRL Y-27907]EGW30644.1 hypothetical protein SPAPADRAFT_142181 [Spathaspora passalidarum NRRL Y-27907]
MSTEQVNGNDQEAVNFPTTILTSKSPDQASLIIPNALNASSQLVGKDLLSWFNYYATIVSNYNQGLRQLIDQGSKISKQSHGGFSNFPKNWNNLINSLQLEFQANETVYKNLRLEIINPLKDLAETDVKLPELLINGQELQEIATNMKNGKQDAEMQWNYKAPQSFANLENYKKHETQLLFDIILNYFQLQNGKMTKSLSDNENSTNYLLGNFKLNNEIKQQLDYLVNAEFAPAPENRGYVNDQIQQQQQLNKNAHPHAAHKRLSTFGRTTSNADTVASGSSSSSSKKPSKLKSRVGSIFGRKKKKDKAVALESTIPENSAPSTAQSTPRIPQSNVVPVPAPALAPALAPAPPPQPRPTDPIQSRETVKEQPPLPAEKKTVLPELPEAGQVTTHFDGTTPEPPVRQINNIPESPNVVAYKDTDEESSSDEEGPEQIDVRQRYEIAEGTPVAAFPTPPPTEAIVAARTSSTLDPGSRVYNRISNEITSIPRSRESSGKYSFEAGDEAKPLAATPRMETTVFPETNGLPEPNLEESPNRTQNAPPPPPTRKVVTHQDLADPGSEKKARITSQMFHNLPDARESFAAPSYTSSSIRPLSSQNTGHSLRSNELFKHQDFADANTGLNASVAEVINANFKDGKLQKSNVLGEVAFNYKTNGEEIPESISVKIPHSYEKVIVNKSFMEDIGDGTYKLSSTPIISKTLGGVKYMDSLDESKVPVIIQQIWKFEPHQSSLMVSLRLNPSIQSKLKLDNLVVSVALNTDIEATSASSKPQGAFNKEKNRITWRFPQALVLDPSHNEERFIARFMTNGLGSEHESGVQLKFQIKNYKFISIYDNDDPSQEIPTFSNLITGTYTGHL